MGVNIRVKDGHEEFTGIGLESILDEYIAINDHPSPLWRILKKVGDDKFVSPDGQIFSKNDQLKVKENEISIDLKWEHITVKGSIYAHWNLPQLTDIQLEEGLVACKFILPKGAVYFQDSYDDEVICSELKFIGNH